MQCRRGEGQPYNAPKVFPSPLPHPPHSPSFSPQLSPGNAHTKKTSASQSHRSHGRDPPISCETPPHSEFGGWTVRGKGKGGRGREGGKNFWGLIWFSRPPALHFAFKKCSHFAPENKKCWQVSPTPGNSRLSEAKSRPVGSSGEDSKRISGCMRLPCQMIARLRVPPVFSTSRISPITIVLSIALHIS